MSRPTNSDGRNESNSDKSRLSHVRSAASAHEFKAYAPILYVAKQNLSEDWEVDNGCVFNRDIKFYEAYVDHLERVLPKSFWTNYLIAAQSAGKAVKCKTKDELLLEWKKAKHPFQCDFVADVRRTPQSGSLTTMSTSNTLLPAEEHTSPASPQISSTTTSGGAPRPWKPKAKDMKRQKMETNADIYPGFAIKQREDSPPGSENSVVMFEITEGNQWQYKLCQLEVRMNVYLKKHTPEKQPQPKTESVFPFVGLFIPDGLMADVKKSLLAMATMLQQEEANPLLTIQSVRGGRFAIVTPTQFLVLNTDEDTHPKSLPPLNLDGSMADPVTSPRTSAWVSSAFVGGHEVCYLVSVVDKELGLDEEVNITRLIEKGEVSSDISGLKEAVLKKFPNKLQGKDVSDLTVYPPTGPANTDEAMKGKALRGGQGLNPSVKENSQTYYRCRIKAAK